MQRFATELAMSCRCRTQLGPALEGKSVSLLHPAVMFSLLITTGYTGEERTERDR